MKTCPRCGSVKTEQVGDCPAGSWQTECINCHLPVLKWDSFNDAQKIRKGDIAICGLGTTGLITNPEPQSVTYEDGSTGVAYVGIHLTNMLVPIGSPWSSRRPIIIGHIDQPNEGIT